MKIIKLILVASYCYMMIVSCDFIGAGTHGKIKQYDFPLSKLGLQQIIDKVILTSPEIYRDTSDHSYYNDGIEYMTIQIGPDNQSSKFIFRYYGDKEMWNASPNSSSIFICYAYNQNNEGGKDGDKSLTPIIRKELISLFEKSFINKISSEIIKK